MKNPAIDRAERPLSAPLGRLLQNSAHNRSLNQTLGNSIQRDFGAQVNYNSVKDLNQRTTANARKVLYRELNAEAQLGTATRMTGKRPH